MQRSSERQLRTLALRMCSGRFPLVPLSSRESPEHCLYLTQGRARVFNFRILVLNCFPRASLSVKRSPIPEWNIWTFASSRYAWPRITPGSPIPNSTDAIWRD